MKLLLPLLLLTACASTGVVATGPNTYHVAKRSAQVGMGQPVGAQADLYREAGEYCAKDGRTLETVKADMSPSGFARPGSASLDFRCVPATR